MAWQPLSTDEVLSLFNDSETDAYNTAKGDDAGAGLGQAIAFVVDEIRDVCRGRTTDLGPAATIPEGFKKIAIGAVRYEFLNALPTGKSLLTEERVAANKKYEEWLEKLREGKVFIPASDDTVVRPPSVSWNSENKLILRTHPVPPPSQQFPAGQTTPPYANPNINDE